MLRIIVVGTATANELIFISGFTVMTSGPWWLGTFSTGLIALIGPFLESPGSAALLIIAIPQIVLRSVHTEEQEF